MENFNNDLINKYIIEISETEKENYNNIPEDILLKIIEILREYYTKILDNIKTYYIEITDIKEEQIFVSKNSIKNLLQKNSISRDAIFDKENSTKFINLFHYISKIYINEMNKMKNILTNLYNINSFSNSFNLDHIFNIDEINKDITSNEIELFDINDNVFKTKKCFIKHLINYIYHNKKLPEKEEVIDLHGKIHKINPNNFNIYELLLKISTLGEIMYKNDNKYIYLYDNKGKKILVSKNKGFKYLNSNINNKLYQSYNNNINNANNKHYYSQSQTMNIKLKKNFKFNIEDEEKNILVKIYDISNKVYLVHLYQIKIFYEKLLKKEKIEKMINLINQNNELIALNINKIRSKPSNYSENLYFNPYYIKNEKNITYHKVTNCLNGEYSLLNTNQIENLLKQFINLDFFYIKIKDIEYKICIEELKENLKNDEYKYIKVNNILKDVCYIQKNYIISYYNNLLNNMNIKEILNIPDINNNNQFINMKNILYNYLDITPFNFYPINFLDKIEETLVQTKGTFKKKKLFNYIHKNIDLYDYLPYKFSLYETIYLRKPFIRKILLEYKLKGKILPDNINVIDNNLKMRNINFKEYFNKFILEKYNTQNNDNNNLNYIKINFLNEKSYVELILNNEKILVSKVKTISLLKDNKNLNKNNNIINIIDIKSGKNFNININLLKTINFKKLWILIKNCNQKDIFVFKSIIKKFIRDKFYNKKIDKENNIEIYDFFYNKNLINPYSILQSFEYKQNKINNQSVIIEIFDK